MPAGSKGPASGIQVAISQYRQSFLYALSQKNYFEACLILGGWGEIIPKEAKYEVAKMPDEAYKMSFGTGDESKIRKYLNEEIRRVEASWREYTHKFYLRGSSNL